jgi:hypothetical protein
VGKQIIGLAPSGGSTPPISCDDVYIVSFTDPDAASFNGWTLNGYPDYDWASLAASFGGNYILDYSSLSPAFTPPSLATFIYSGPTPPPDLVGTDDLSNPVSYSFTKYCDKKVLQLLTDGLTNGGIIRSITIGDITLDLLLYGGPVYIGDPAAPNIISSALQVYFGPDAYCLIHLANGLYPQPWTIDVFNVYTNTPAVANYVGPLFFENIWNANQFDFTSIVSTTFSDLSYDNVYGDYVYGLDYINWIVPSDFIINIKFDSAYNFYYGTTAEPPTTLVPNGSNSYDDPFSNNMNLNGLNLNIRIQNGYYIQLASCKLCNGGVSYTDFIDISTLYGGYLPLQNLGNQIKF